MQSKRAGIVLCHEVWGVSQALRATAAAYERQGHAVAIADLYDGAYTDDYGRASTRRDALDLLEIRAGVQHALDDVHRQGATQVAVIGYSMGGSIALWAATSLRIGLAVSYYAGGISHSYWRDMPPGLRLAGRLAVPWIGFYGGRDSLTPPADLRALTIAASRARSRQGSGLQLSRSRLCAGRHRPPI